MERNGIVPDAFRESIFLREGYSSTVFFRTFAVPHAMDFLAYDAKMLWVRQCSDQVIARRTSLYLQCHDKPSEIVEDKAY